MKIEVTMLVLRTGLVSKTLLQQLKKISKQKMVRMVLRNLTKKPRKISKSQNNKFQKPKMD